MEIARATVFETYAPAATVSLAPTAREERIQTPPGTAGKTTDSLQNARSEESRT
jgi:hypothetical protein